MQCINCVYLVQVYIGKTMLFIFHYNFHFFTVAAQTRINSFIHYSTYVNKAYCSRRIKRVSLAIWTNQPTTPRLQHSHFATFTQRWCYIHNIIHQMHITDAMAALVYTCRMSVRSLSTADVIVVVCVLLAAMIVLAMVFMTSFRSFTPFWTVLQNKRGVYSFISQTTQTQFWQFNWYNFTRPSLTIKKWQINM